MDFSLPPPAIIHKAPSGYEAGLLVSRHGQVPGFMPSVPYVSSAPLTSISHFDDATGVSSTIGFPAGIASGDICIVFLRGNVAEPADFTTVRADLGIGVQARICVKKLTGAETGIALTSLESWITAVFRGNGAFSSISGHSLNGAQTSANPPTQTISSASTATLPAIAFGQMITFSGSISPRDTSPTMSELSANSSHYAHYAILNSSPVDYDYNMDDEGSANTMQSGYLRFA